MFFSKNEHAGCTIHEFFTSHPERIDLMTEWNQVRHIHGQLSMTREHLRLRNHNIMLSYQAAFGPLEIQAAEKQLGINVMEKKLALLRDHSDLPHDLAEHQAREALAREFSDFAKKKASVANVIGLMGLANTKRPMDGGYDPAELARVVGKTRKAVFMTHPDTVGSLPYTPEQNKRLRELFDRVMEIRIMEFGSVIRNEAILDEILSAIKLIHAQMGHDLDDDVLPMGTEEEQINHIRIQVASLNRQVEMLQDEVTSLMNVPEISRMATILADPILGARTRERLEEIISRLSLRHLRLEEELETLCSERLPVFIEE
ncbi:MAG: hypothetical protein HQL73_10435 [Magnetococcales bacterium]|nr:hypothetical protein [Magnetococcales bacterium]